MDKVESRGDHFRFGSVFIKKINQTKFFKNKTETEPQPGQTDRFRFGFLGQKPVQTDLARFSRFWLGFFGFGSVFSVLARFSGFCLVFSVWLGFSGLARFFFRFFLASVQFFGFLLMKPNRTGWFF
jgi:hypothetical protein